MSRITALAVIAAALAHGSEASAFEIKHTDGGELVRWRQSSVTWTVDRSVQEVPGGEAAVVAAVDAWTQRAGGPTLAVGETGASLRPGLDGVSAIFFARDGYAPAGDALAVTLLSFDADTGEVLEADIVINGKYHFAPVTTNGAPPRAPQSATSGTYDIGRVLAHEMGHALALSDEPALESALMFPYVPRGRALATAPAKDDLAGISALYAMGAARSQPPAGAASHGGCTAAMVASGCVRETPTGAWSCIGVLMGAIVVMRHRQRIKTIPA